MTASLRRSNPDYRGRHDVEVDAGGCLVAPGLINAHVHPGTSPRSRGLAEDAEIVEDGAYYHVTLPTQMLGPQVLDDDDVAAITAWDVAASLLGGATTIVAEYFGSPKHWIPLVERVGFRGQLGANLSGKPRGDRLRQGWPDRLGGSEGRRGGARGGGAAA